MPVTLRKNVLRVKNSPSNNTNDYQSLDIISDESINARLAEISSLASEKEIEINTAASTGTAEIYNAKNSIINDISDITDFKFGEETLEGVSIGSWIPGNFVCNVKGAQIALAASQVPGYFYSIIPCAEGDTVIISAHGGNAARTWAYLDSNQVVLDYDPDSSAGHKNDILPSPPENTAYVLLHSKTNSTYVTNRYGIVGKYLSILPILTRLVSIEQNNSINL